MSAWVRIILRQQYLVKLSSSRASHLETPSSNFFSYRLHRFPISFPQVKQRTGMIILVLPFSGVLLRVGRTYLRTYARVYVYIYISIRFAFSLKMGALGWSSASPPFALHLRFASSGCPLRNETPNTPIYQATPRLTRLSLSGPSSHCCSTSSSFHRAYACINDMALL